MSFTAGDFCHHSVRPLPTTFIGVKSLHSNSKTLSHLCFPVLVFAELLRSFGARSETKPVWRISLFTNLNLLIVVAVSFGLQVWSQHNALLGRFLKTSIMPFADGFLLLALGTIPLLVLELVKVLRDARRRRVRRNSHPSCVL